MCIIHFMVSVIDFEKLPKKNFKKDQGPFSYTSLIRLIWHPARPSYSRDGIELRFS